MKKSHSPKTLPLSFASVMVLGSALAHAQSGPMEEMIVTAQKREQSLQDVPVAVTAFNADALKDQGVSDITELQKSSPNTVLQTSRGTNSTITAFIRGVGQADPLWGFEPGVGLYVDDIYYARPQAGVLDVYDVDRIEVLRGPQGTLYGKNTIGGAVKYVTKRLSGDPEFSVNATVGSYNQRDVIVSGELPITDQLAVGASVASLQRDGFGEFLLNGDENYNKDVLAARVSIEFTATDTLWFRFAADMTEDDSNAKGGHRLTQSLLLPNEAPPSDVYDTWADMDTDNSVESSGASFTVNWDINDAFAFKSITAYREGETDTNIDFDNTSFASVHVPAIYDDDQFTQEFQLNYESTHFHMVSGIYFYEGTASGAFDVLLGAFDTADLLGDGSNVVGNFNALTAGSVDTESIALYAHATYDFTESLSATLGARYTRDEKDATVFKNLSFVDGNSTRLGGQDLAVLAVNTDYSNDDSWSEFSPRISIDYRINDDVMTYASYSHGFKSGGFDMRGDAAANPETTEGYDPETVDTFEVGVKTESFDNRLRMNAALFYTDYDDLQVTVQSATAGGSNFVSAVLNAGKADVQGAELELMADLGAGFGLQAAMGYTDADFTEVITQTVNGPVDVSDDWEFNFTPEFSGYLALNYNMPLGDTGDVNWVLSASHKSETRIFPQVASAVDEDSYTLVDASVVWRDGADHWSVGLHGKNLTDKEYRVGGYNFFGLGLEDSIIGYYGNPRTVALSVNYNF